MKRTCKNCGTKCLQLSAVCHTYTPDPAARDEARFWRLCRKHNGFIENNHT